ncbi:hypothetical protein BegalDRAFT_0094 [Beggiatoa alba B18LD]|uniref:Uncharacterized protein n=1 Tax=Beggiatoa alba B18LD TaxID=395493 RepID=I3CBM5_9GAMM|nr:hypothetical protein BegalDRAFT_0094 [Beggiatoa alba B18LD]
MSSAVKNPDSDNVLILSDEFFSRVPTNLLDFENLAGICFILKSRKTGGLKSMAQVVVG